jgi:hypothetical protein
MARSVSLDQCSTRCSSASKPARARIELAHADGHVLHAPAGVAVQRARDDLADRIDDARESLGA